MWLDELPDDAIDPSSRVPLHRQLSTVLRARITDGTLSAGTHFPTESELQQRFGISRSVVRQALLALSDDGLIRRGRGRGSVVAPRGEHHRLVQRISGLSTQIAEVTTTVLSLGRDDDPHARAVLGVTEVLGMRRLRSAGGEPIAVIDTWLPYSLAGELTADALTDASLHATLRRRYDITVVAERRQVRGVAASVVLARHLGVETGAPLLLLEGSSTDAAGVPVEVFRTWHRGDRVVFDIDVLPGLDARSAGFDESAGRGSADVAAAGSLGEGVAGGEGAGGAGVAGGAGGAGAAGLARADTAARMRSLARELAELSDELDRP